MSIVLYSTGCPKCSVLKKKLDAAGIQYIENNDIETMQGFGITQVPVLAVDDDMLEFSDAVKWVNSINIGDA